MQKYGHLSKQISTKLKEKSRYYTKKNNNNETFTSQTVKFNHTLRVDRKGVNWGLLTMYCVRRHNNKNKKKQI